MTAIELGHDYLVLTDHSPRLKVARGLSAERLRPAARRRRRRQRAPRARRSGFTLLKGIEVDILDDGSLDQTDEMLGRLDVRVASVHSKLAMDAAPMTRRMIGAVRNRHTNVLGHCTGRLVTGSRGTRAPVAVRRQGGLRGLRRARRGGRDQLPSRAPRPADDLLELARDAGCVFSIDSDAHAPGQLDFLVLGCERAEEAGIDADRIVNTWPRERLLEWARK